MDEEYEIVFKNSFFLHLELGESNHMYLPHILLVIQYKCYNVFHKMNSMNKLCVLVGRITSSTFNKINPCAFTPAVKTVG